MIVDYASNELHLVQLLGSNLANTSLGWHWLGWLHRCDCDSFLTLWTSSFVFHVQQDQRFRTSSTYQFFGDAFRVSRSTREAHRLQKFSRRGGARERKGQARGSRSERAGQAGAGFIRGRKTGKGDQEKENGTGAVDRRQTRAWGQP